MKKNIVIDDRFFSRLVFHGLPPLEKRAGAKRACPNKVMAHVWFMHDAHLGCALFFLDMLSEFTLLSMTVMVTPCLWYVVGMNLVCPMSKFPQAPFARAPFRECQPPAPPPPTLQQHPVQFVHQLLCTGLVLSHGLNKQDCEPARPLLSAFRSLRARNAEKVSKMWPGLRPRNPEPSPKILGNSPKRRFQHFPETLQSLFALFPRLFLGFSGFRRPRDTFSGLFSAFRARRARETSVRGGLVRKSKIQLTSR